MSPVERGSGDRPALSRLIPVDTDAFARQWWGKKPLFTRSAQLDLGVAELFSADAVDELVADRAIRTPFVRMAREGDVLASSRYTSSGGFGAEISDQLDSAKVLKEFADGSTLVLQGLHRTWEPIATFTRQLVSDLGHPCQVNAYVTPASSRGFDPHYDVHDVFVIQIAGEKAWTIHEPVHPDPLRDQPWSDHRAEVEARAEEEPAIAETFRPGDVLYLPRGWIHSATALGGTSIHLTIGVSAYTRFEIVQRLLEGAAQTASLRESLPLGIDLSDAEALKPIVDDTVAALTDALTGTDRSAELATALSARFRGATTPQPVRPLATVDALADFDPASVLTWRDSLRARLVRTDTAITIQLRDRSVSLPIEAAEAVEALYGGAAAPAAALPGLDQDSSLVVSRRLLREAVLVVV